MIGDISATGHVRKRHDSKEEKMGHNTTHRSLRRSCPRKRMMILGVFISLAFLYLVVTHRGTLLAMTGSSSQYVVVIDAGSTGSRVHMFELIPDGAGYKMLVDHFLPLEPGLSSYGNDPPKAAESLRPLLDYAMKVVPTHAVAQSAPIVVRATAGLRILSDDVAKNILNKVDEFIRVNYPFRLAKEGGVEIMTGEDEGIFAWISLNYFLGGLDVPGVIPTAAIDLGGGSFQLTFQAANPENIATRDEDVKSITVGGAARDIYVHSHLGMGLKEARLAVLQKVEGETENTRSSACLPSVYKGQWEHAGNTYSLRGAVNSGYEACFDALKEAFRGRITPIRELNDKKIYVFSYFFDKAKDAGLVADVAGGTISVAAFVDAAKKACTAQLVDQRFQCLDLTYIGYLLNEAYGLPLQHEVTVAKKVNGEELSWALGAAFNVLNQQH